MANLALRLPCLTCHCYPHRKTTFQYVVGSTISVNPGWVNVSRSHIFSANMAAETRSILPILGDGNCLFRSLSAFLLQGQFLHLHLRKATCKFIVAHAPKFSAILGGENLLAHAKTMSINGTWGTEVEIFAVATMFQCPIYVYSRGGSDVPRWFKYEPVFQI